jgi:hypothetical protein
MHGKYNVKFKKTLMSLTARAARARSEPEINEERGFSSQSHFV